MIVSWEEAICTGTISERKWGTQDICIEVGNKRKMQFGETKSLQPDRCPLAYQHQ